MVKVKNKFCGWDKYSRSSISPLLIRLCLPIYQNTYIYILCLSFAIFLLNVKKLLHINEHFKYKRD